MKLKAVFVLVIVLMVGSIHCFATESVSVMANPSTSGEIDLLSDLVIYDQNGNVVPTPRLEIGKGIKIEPYHYGVSKKFYVGRTGATFYASVSNGRVQDLGAYATDQLTNIDYGISNFKNTSGDWYGQAKLSNVPESQYILYIHNGGKTTITIDSLTAL